MWSSCAEARVVALELGTLDAEVGGDLGGSRPSHRVAWVEYAAGRAR